MTDTQNILDKFENFNVKYILLGFANTQDACSTNKGPTVGEPGTMITGDSCGKPGVVILNEFADFSYVIEGFQSEFNYYSNLQPTSTEMTGEIIISDRLGAQFPTFLRDCAKKLGVSETHIAFQLKIYFVGMPKNSATTETFVTKPFIFNMGVMSQSHSTEFPHLYYMNFLATYNTFGLITGFSKMYQTTITSADGNPSKEIPKPDAPMATIIPRGAEDGLKTDLRKQRIDKSKPMETLDDIFKGLAEDLQQQKYEHKRQLQEWLSFVRDDHTKKIDQPKQKKSPGYLPLEYKIILDNEYKSYKVDNRNIPFEQPEQSQEKYGVRSIPVPEGEHVLSTIKRLMKYSRRTGKDGDSKPKKTYKLVNTVIKTCEDKYEVNLRIKKVILPSNDPSGDDTGPGDAVEPIEMEFQKTGTKDIDILSINGKTVSKIDLTMMEKQVEERDAEVVFGNREQATAERTSQVDFFNSMFSGVRTNINNHNNGLESAEDAGKADILAFPNIAAQNNKFEVRIRGNPELLSDLFRNPMSVKNADPDSPRFYPTPEFSPMYAKIKVYLDPIAASLGVKKDNSDNIYYYVKYHHMYKIRTVITGNNFIQYLNLLRSDDAT